jgi:TnpA family transposase
MTEKIQSDKASNDGLKSMIDGMLNIKHFRAHWDEKLRLTTSINQGEVTAFLTLRKLGSYLGQNGLTVELIY